MIAKQLLSLRAFQFIGLGLCMVSMGVTRLKATNYFVNDNSTSGDFWSGAAGNNANTGSAALPYATLAHVISTHVLGVGDTVFVDAGTYLDKNITLGASDAGVVIYGAGRDYTIFDGVNFTQTFLTISGNGTVLNGIEMRRYAYNTGLKGQALTIADAINVRVDNCTFNNLGTSGGEAALYITTTAAVNTSATVNDCVFKNISGNFGGGLDICSNTLSAVPTLNVTVTNCLFESVAKNNYNGGAMLVYNGLSAGSSTQAPVVTMSNCVFGSSGNSCRAARGGAIYIDNGATVNLSGACFAFCEAIDVAGPDGGGAIYIADGTMNLTDAVLFQNSANTGTPKYGGAIYINKLFSGTSTLNATRCIFHDNSALDGGALYLDRSTVNLRNCLFYSNSSNDEGGAICVNDANANLLMYNCTLAANTSAGGASAHGGLESKTNQTAVVKNSIFWGNTRGEVVDEGTGTIDVSFSVVDPTGASVFNNIGSNTNTDPQFVGGGDYRLQVSSPAIGAATTDGGAAPTDDVVGTGRDASPDKGAYEFGATITTTRDCPSIRNTLLPVEDVQLAATCVEEGVLLQWNAGNGDVASWPEGSVDGKTFELLASSAFAEGYQQFIMAEADGLMQHFRIRMRYPNGEETVSPVVSSSCALEGPAIAAFPTVFTDEIHIRVSNCPDNDIRVGLVDMSGKLIVSLCLHAGGEDFVLPLPDVRPGVYLLNVRIPSNGNEWAQRVVKF